MYRDVFVQRVNRLTYSLNLSLGHGEVDCIQSFFLRWVEQQSHVPPVEQWSGALLQWDKLVSSSSARCFRAWGRPVALAVPYYSCPYVLDPSKHYGMWYRTTPTCMVLSGREQGRFSWRGTFPFGVAMVLPPNPIHCTINVHKSYTWKDWFGQSRRHLVVTRIMDGRVIQNGFPFLYFGDRILVGPEEKNMFPW
jgi:hypothetical protein